MSVDGLGVYGMPDAMSGEVAENRGEVIDCLSLETGQPR
jgi:hypothetical protein